MHLSNELLGKRIFTMHSSVEKCGGELWGILTVKTIRGIKSAGTGGITRSVENHGRRWLGRGFVLPPDTDHAR